MSPQFWAPDGWAWGIVKIRDHPGLRYGVVSPNGMSAGEIVIMTGHGETAEGWFETARWLVDQDYSVWVLEAAGQGGSGRYGEPRDVAQAPDFTADMDGVRALVAGIIRPKTRNPVSVIASGAAAPAAIAALSHGMPARALILSAPGDGAFPAGGAGWSRPKSTTGLTVRQREQLGWMIVNPDLRMGGAARTWRTPRSPPCGPRRPRWCSTHRRHSSSTASCITPSIAPSPCAWCRVRCGCSSARAAVATA